MTRDPIVVVGGGIGGLALALALARRGRRVRVLERAAEFGEIGAGIQLAPNASRVLEELGVLDSIRPLAVFPQRMLWMDAISGEPLTALDLGAPFRERYGYAYVVMHRHDLLSALLDGCRSSALIDLETDKDVLALEDRPGRTLATCADGTSYEAELLVGADGLWSPVRAFVAGDGEPVCSAFVAYRGAIPMDQVSEHAGLDNVMLWTGPAMHLVQYPLRAGELYNQVAVFRSARYRPESDDWGTPEELDEHFGRGAPLVRSALARFKRNRRWPMYDRPPIPTWTRGRATLLGDAAHPLLQYLAQGAAQALEDALTLAEALAAYDEISDALRAYERERIPRTARVQTTSRAWGEFWHVPPERLAARNAHLTGRRPDDYEPMDWLYGYGTRDRGAFAVHDR